MSSKPSDAWYLAPICLCICGSVIMWFVLKDEKHPDAAKMIKKGWTIGIMVALVIFMALEFTGQINFIDYRPS